MSMRDLTLTSTCVLAIVLVALLDSGTIDKFATANVLVYIQLP